MIEYVFLSSDINSLQKSDCEDFEFSIQMLYLDVIPPLIASD